MTPSLPNLGRRLEAMSDERMAENLIQHAIDAGLEPFLWRKRVYWQNASGIHEELRAEIIRLAIDVKDALTRRYVLERAEPGQQHKWVIRLGDDPRVKDALPALLACGPERWWGRMLRQIASIATTDGEKRRWLVLEQDQVGALFRDERGVLVATTVVLPDGSRLGGKKGSLAEVVSACPACATPPVSTETLKEVVEGDDD